MSKNLAIRVRDVKKVYSLSATQTVGLSGLWKKLKAFVTGKREEKSDLFWALKGVNFDVEKGEILGVIGRNGAGKSTLLKLLSRITTPTSGSIQVNGRMASLLEVGTGFHPELTGRENVFLNGAILGMSKNEISEKFDEIVAFSGTEQFIDTPVKYYSSGMYVRLAFSVAAHLNPEILIIDEVLAVGDTAFQKKCVGKMEGVSRSGKTILLVSHNLAIIRQLCKRTLIIDKGQLYFEGPTAIALAKFHELLRAQKIDSEESMKERMISHSGAVRFQELRILDEKNKERYDFKMGEKLKLQFTYKVYEDVSNLIVRVSFRSLGSSEIVTNVEHTLSETPLKAGSEHTVIVEYDNVALCPREYSLYLWMANKEGIAFDRIDYSQTSCPIVTITSDTLPQNMDPGYFQMPSRVLEAAA